MDLSRDTKTTRRKEYLHQKREKKSRRKKTNKTQEGRRFFVFKHCVFLATEVCCDCELLPRVCAELVAINLLENIFWFFDFAEARNERWELREREERGRERVERT